MTDIIDIPLALLNRVYAQMAFDDVLNAAVACRALYLDLRPFRFAHLRARLEPRIAHRPQVYAYAGHSWAMWTVTLGLFELTHQSLCGQHELSIKHYDDGRVHGRQGDADFLGLGGPHPLGRDTAAGDALGLSRFR